MKFPTFRTLVVSSCILGLSLTLWLFAKSADQGAPAPKLENLDRILNETFVAGQGLGKIRIGERAFPLITDLLGTTNVVMRTQLDPATWGDWPFYDYEVYIYTRDYSTEGLEIKVAPSGKEGRIYAVSVDETFRGQTEEGVRMGDPVTKVLHLYGKPEFQEFHVYESSTSMLTYADGTTFRFDSNERLKRLEVEDPKIQPVLRLLRATAGN